MSLAMALLLGAPVHAAAPDSILFVNEKGVQTKLEGGGQNHFIYLGRYPQSKLDDISGLDENDYIKLPSQNRGDLYFLKEPIKWRILENVKDTDGNYTGRLFLLSDTSLDTVRFHDLPNGTFEQDKDLTWKTSSMRAWLNGYKDTEIILGKPGKDYSGPGKNFKDDAFSAEEQGAIAITHLENPDNPTWNSFGGEDTDDRIFLLTQEDTTMRKYGFSDDNSRISRNTDYTAAGGKLNEDTNPWPSGKGTNWWTRTPGELADYDPYMGVKRMVFVQYHGGFIDWGWTYSAWVTTRPAMNIDLRSVTLVSNAYDGKNKNASPSPDLQPVGGNHNGHWKLTVKDKAHENFDVDSVATCDNKILNIKYSGAVAGKEEYISAIIVSKDNYTTCYGRLALSSSENNAKVRINIDGRMRPGDTLYLFNEQCNRDMDPTNLDIIETDFSSSLVPITLPQSLHDMQPATCMAPKKCSDCDYTEGDPDSLAHNYGDWTKCDEQEHQKICAYNATHIMKATHSWDEGKVTKSATEQAEGIRTYTCTLCEATRTETIPRIPPTPKPTTPKVSGTLLPRATAGRSSLTISWNRIRGADGYDIFFALCNHSGKKKACKNVKTIKGNKTFKWIKSGLKKGTAYKFYVRAYVTKNGKKTYVSKSPMMHAYTGNGTKNYTNAKSVTVNKTKVTLKKGKTFKIKATVNKVSKKKKLMPKSHAPALRYITSDKKIATVNSKGKIKAKAKGKCTIYAYAHNGVSKKVKVTVK